MGMYQPPKYRKKNKDTGLWEWIIPPMEDLSVKKYDTRTYNTEINRRRLQKEREAKNREFGL